MHKSILYNSTMQKPPRAPARIHRHAFFKISFLNSFYLECLGLKQLYLASITPQLIPVPIHQRSQYLEQRNNDKRGCMVR